MNFSKGSILIKTEHSVQEWKTSLEITLNNIFYPRNVSGSKFMFLLIDWLIDWGFLLYPQYFSHLKEIAVKKYGQFWNLEVSLAALTSLHYKSSKSREMVFCVPRCCYPWHRTISNIPSDGHSPSDATNQN